MHTAKAIELWRWALFGFLRCCASFLCNVLAPSVEHASSCRRNVEPAMERLSPTADLWLGFYLSLAMEWNTRTRAIGTPWGRSLSRPTTRRPTSPRPTWSSSRWGVVALCRLSTMNLRRFFERLAPSIYFFLSEESCYGRVEVRQAMTSSSGGFTEICCN